MLCSRRPPLLPTKPASATSETIAAAILAAAAAIMAAGYLLDLAHLPLHPFVLAIVAGVSAWAAYTLSRRASGDSGADDRPMFVAAIAVTAAYFLWHAWPSLLPVTIGPDLVHHLQLIQVIQRTRGLPHDEALYPYLLEMMNYTPGAHILAATAAGWARVDAVRFIHPLAVCFVALKAGLLYAVARRLLPEREGRVHALAAPLLAFVPSIYFTGSVLHFFFFSQVVSETFAIAMLLAAIAWWRTGDARQLPLFVLWSVAVFLSWPVWLGPGLTVFLAAVLLSSRPWSSRVRAAAIGVLPVVVIAAIHVAWHPAAGGILSSSGAVTEPSVQGFGALFLLLAAVGAALGVRDGAGRIVILFLAALLVQSAALAWLARRAGSNSPYMAFKMMHLAILPAAILGAAALARVTRRFAVIAVGVALALAIWRLPFTRAPSPIVLTAYEAGIWTRDAHSTSCVDYFTKHWLTGYWLHLDVLGNPRLSDRMRAESFDFPDTATKWLVGRGLPFAIVEDLSAVPRDIREDMTVLRRFGAVAVVRNNRPAACADQSPPLWRVARR